MIDAAQNHEELAAKLLWTFAGSSLLFMASGGYIVAAGGGSALTWTMNLLAWFLGAAAAVAISRRRPPLLLPVAMAATCGLALTFFDGGLESVHRWRQLGPVRINDVMLLLPATIVTLVRSGASLPTVAGGSITLSLLPLAQPDAS